MCAAPFCMKQLTYHTAGNFLMQMMICVASAARRAVQDLCTDSPSLLALASCHGLIFKSLKGDFSDMWEHKSGSFVLDCVVSSVDGDELLDLIDEVTQSGRQLLASQWGHKLLKKLLDRAVRVFCDRTHAFDA
jgi:hypothetical protein